MKVKIREIDLLQLSNSDHADANRVIHQSESASVFHTVEWNRLIIEEFGLRHVALLATVDEKPAGLYIYYPLRDNTYQSPMISLQSVYGGPIAIKNYPDVISALLRESEKKEPMSFFQVWTPPKIDPTPYSHAGYGTQEMFTPIILLNGSEEERWLKLGRDKRYKIRKAISNGAVFVDADVKDLAIYRNMVSMTMANMGKDPLPLAFYHRLIEQLGPLGMAKLFFVKIGEEIVSGTIILYCKETLYGWDIGWRREFANLSPNDFMVWSIQQHGYEQGYKYFDLLRIEPDRLPGVAKWKTSFNPEIETCYFIQKKTLEYRLFHPIKTLFTNPQKAFSKVQTLLSNNGEK